MRKQICVTLLFCLLLGFRPKSSSFTPQTLDTNRLELLVLSRINQERIRNNLKSLTTNYILQQAALDQAKYVSGLGKLSHSQPLKEKAKAKDRVKYYGGSMQAVGENIAYIKIFESAVYKGETGTVDTTTISSYEQAADYLVYAWLNSAPHKTNILFPKYTETGVKVVYNAKLKTLFSVQVFAYPFE
jgi:uncharacterized protein YkwD